MLGEWRGWSFVLCFSIVHFQILQLVKLSTNVNCGITTFVSINGAAQNKNATMTQFLYIFVRTTSIQKIKHRRAEPGHSCLLCDRCFGVIEKCKNMTIFFGPHTMPSIFGNHSKVLLIFLWTKVWFLLLLIIIRAILRWLLWWLIKRGLKFLGIVFLSTIRVTLIELLLVSQPLCQY